MKDSLVSKILLTVNFLLIPFIVLANAGSPIIWFNVIHLLIVNAIIGFIESLILVKYKLPNKEWIIVIANYVSMIVGFYVIIPGVVKPKYGRDLWSNSGDIFIGFCLSFIVTLLIEYPFFIAALKDKKQRKVLLKPFIVANIVTNAAMICIYFLLMEG